MALTDPAAVAQAAKGQGPHVASRIIIHWTAGRSVASALDLEHYHVVVEASGAYKLGECRISDNNSTRDGKYAAHTLGSNTRCIGLSLCGMAGARENPFAAGPSPINLKQLESCCALAAELCEMYSIPVTKQTVLTHAEVERNLGIKQRGKWDITRFPWDSSVRGAEACGNVIRDMVRQAMDRHEVPSGNAARPSQTRSVTLNKRPLVQGVLEDGAVLVPIHETVAGLQAAGFGVKLLSPYGRPKDPGNSQVVIAYATATYQDKAVWIDGKAYSSVRELADLLDLALEYDQKSKEVRLSSSSA